MRFGHSLNFLHNRWKKKTIIAASWPNGYSDKCSSFWLPATTEGVTLRRWRFRVQVPARSNFCWKEQSALPQTIICVPYLLVLYCFLSPSHCYFYLACFIFYNESTTTRTISYLPPSQVFVFWQPARPFLWLARSILKTGPVLHVSI